MPFYNSLPHCSAKASAKPGNVLLLNFRRSSVDIFVLNDAGIKDQVGISCDYYGKTISSGASFTDHFVFVLPESANKDLNNMTLEVGGLPIHLYRYSQY